MSGVIVSSKPVCEEASRTDEQGRFRVTWRQRSNVHDILLLARNPERNLAALAEVKDQSRPVGVKLSPAFVVRGRITDPNGNGHLDDEEVIKAYQTDQYYANFGPVKVVFQVEDGPVTYHLNFRLLDYDERKQLYIYSGGWYEGQITVAG